MPKSGIVLINNPIYRIGQWRSLPTAGFFFLFYIYQMKRRDIMANTMYRSQQGKEAILGQYEDYLQRLNIDISRTYVDTSFGKTHILEIGPRDAKPIIVLQGGNCINPMTLSWFKPLFSSYRLIAPDTMGHPGFSDETRMSAKDGSFAQWIADLQNHYGIRSCAFIGASYGGGIILNLAAHLPERITCAVLVAPAGICMGSKWTMIKRVLIPLLVYKATSSAAALQRIADELSFGHMDEIDKQIIGDIFTHVRLEQDMPESVSEAALKDYTAPTLLLTGSRDIFFPGEEVVQRARRIIPNLADTKIYCESGHFPSPEAKEMMNADIRGFLNEKY
ncbi:alpha/beta fold hydrolase [Paenibacillus silviterrae]|uniref:alpha/beta fold hydrolase n=1 Tax=Paenibacillus silviterrae TaxID=3242194 RepID=UPI00254347FA|nr:alpha/beta hydrolase [Paenibacillus chinjuensis]